MNDADLFSSGFAWDDHPVADSADAFATASATAESPVFRGVEASHGQAIAAVAAVAKQREDSPLSQNRVAPVATAFAIARTTDFRRLEPYSRAPIAAVATVANWEDGVASLIEGRVPLGTNRIEWKGLVSDARQLMRLWGHDLHSAGWSTCDVFGVEPTMSHRRVDRLGLVGFVSGGEVEAIDRDSAVTRHGKSRLTFNRRLRGAGSVPLWTISEGEMA